jgi:PAS domain S-box-containing protein
MKSPMGFGENVMTALPDEAKTIEELRRELYELRRRLALYEDRISGPSLRRPEDQGIEGELRASEGQLRLFIDHAPVALAMFNRRMQYIRASRRWLHDYALGDRDLRGLCHYELFPEIPERWREAHRRGLSGEIVRAEEERFARADGSEQWMRWEVRPWFEAAGEVGGIVLFTEDITEIKRTERALRESEEQFRILFENSPVAMVVIDPVTLRFLKVNEKALAVSGYSKEEIASLTIVDLEADLTLDELLAKGEELREKGWHQFETRIRTRSGELHELFLTGQVIHIGGRPYLLQIFEDISTRKAIERELIRARDAAEEATRAKGEFVANMSHEIRTPLTVIVAAVELLLQMSNEPDQKELLEMAGSSGDHLQALIEDILDFSRIEARRLHIRTVDFDLRKILGRALEIFRIKAREKCLQLRQEIDPAAPAFVNGDPDRLCQVLINLIGNAVKFTDRGSVTLQVECRPDDLLFSVRDTGIGIAADDQERLFQSFTQLDSSHTRKYGGTGLGLAISRSLVELMGGIIWVESERGAGSVFSFSFPLRATVPAAEGCDIKLTARNEFLENA